MTFQIRGVSYEGFGPQANGLVAYVIKDSRVYFSGFSSPNKSTSTINAAENIVAAICTKEGIRWSDVEFFDIKTRRGYSREPGFFEIMKLSLAPDPENFAMPSPSWQVVSPADIPQEVLVLFQSFVI